jgi:cell division protein FtsW (lipid II flippase)
MSIIPIIGVLTHMYLSRAHPGADMLLLPSSCTLAGIGLIVVDRLRPELAIRQAVWLLLGLLGIVAGCWIAGHRDWLLRYRYTIGAAGIALTTATLILGVDPNGSGARLWFSVGGVSLQPVELMKVLLVIWLSGYLYEHGEVIRLGRGKVGPFGIPPLPYLAPLGIVLLLSELLLVVQRDLGAGLLLSLVFTLTIYAATARISVLVLGLGSLVGAGWLSRNLFSHVALRISIWLDPWSQSDGAGFQVIQGLIALANGGILGTGLGLGSPTLVPAIHTDFSIAAISEELGLAGALGVLALYAVLLNRCFRISLRHADRYGQILATGLSTVLGVQTLLILGGVLKLLPLTGITLPWISYGGSSILANALILGMLLRLSSEIADDA